MDFIQMGIKPIQNIVNAAANFISEMITETATAADMSLKRGAVKRGHKSAKPAKKQPKWHDQSCRDVFLCIKRTSYCLSKDPNNAWLRGKLSTETKAYKKLLKSKQKEFLNSAFNELDTVYSNDPKAYMDIVKALREGRHDKVRPGDTDSVAPEEWHEHFSNLLGKEVTLSDQEKDMQNFVSSNIDSFSCELDQTFTKKELLDCVKKLKNNKASSFDRVNNEMLKAGISTLSDPLLLLFNTILKNDIYPSSWKLDILGPLHKSGPKDDPNNFRGICVSSCIGKLFNTLLRCRLEKKCVEMGWIGKYQLSGKKGARTSDHLLVLRFLIDKYVRGRKQKLFICFFDLRKAFDTVSRVRLFYQLLTEYQVGGNFLKIVNNIYTENKMFVKLEGGLTDPFVTTVGVKQGCVLSPMLFNLFINKLPEVYDTECDPVFIDGEPTHALMWADNVAVLSLSKNGLQKAITKTVRFFNSLGLTVNTSKTKVMVLNVRGLGPDAYRHMKFYAEDKEILITNEYLYLGMMFKPSGSFTCAIQELHSKANKAWFSISNILYENKKMPVNRALGLFDSLVSPVSLYGCEVWTPFTIPSPNFTSLESLLKSWESFQPELLNQRVCRLVLSVQKKASRLAVLGELGRYPVFLKALIHCLKYEWCLSSQSNQPSLISGALREMGNLEMAGFDCWLRRINQIKKILGLPNFPAYMTSVAVSKAIKSHVQGVFERFWLDEINKVRISGNGQDCNKLRFYKQFKGSFTTEPYIDLVKNRNQRSSLTRMRISAHHLAIETGRWTKPIPTPMANRLCKYCSEEAVDSEAHFLLHCPTFNEKRNCLIGKLSCLIPTIRHLSDKALLVTLLCPVTAQVAKLINKFILIMFKARDKIQGGLHASLLTFPPVVDHYQNESVVDSSESECQSDTESTCSEYDSE